LEQQIDYSQKFDRIEELLGTNHDLCQRIVDTALEFYNVDVSELDKHVRQREASGYGTDRVSVSQSLKHFVRDWSDAGICEREPTFPCLLRSLADLFADPLAEGQRPKVLVPGAGLGRLGHEIAKLGKGSH
jgi:carnosine N-methyltransferase